MFLICIISNMRAAHCWNNIRASALTIHYCIGSTLVKRNCLKVKLSCCLDVVTYVKMKRTKWMRLLLRSRRSHRLKPAHSLPLYPGEERPGLPELPSRKQEDLFQLNRKICRWRFAAL